MSELALNVHESMVILDGGRDAELPDGSGGPILPGPEAVFIGGRVDVDAHTSIRIGDWGTPPGDLVLAYEGAVETPTNSLRLVDIDGGELASVPVRNLQTPIRIYLTDLQEPDEILIAADGIAWP